MKKGIQSITNNVLGSMIKKTQYTAINLLKFFVFRAGQV